jgi:aminoglycoside/choline kinase family phosphotransferase
LDKSPIIISNHYPELVNLYQQEFGMEIICYQPLTAHGSDREIIRLGDSNGNSSIGIFNENVSENRAFIEFDRHFRNFGMNVPLIYRISDDMRFYLMEDLGDTTLLIKIKENPSRDFGEKEIDLYKKALLVLPEFQIKAGPKIDFSLCYQFDEFGDENIEYDINYFKERFLLQFYKDSLDFELLNDDLNFLKARVMEIPNDYFLYRDFQSRNIMIKEGELYFIDFQSGRKGSLLYDLASLLYDAKAKVPQHIREMLIDYYMDVLKDYAKIDEEKMKDYFWYYAIIRILQAMGAYGFLGIVKGKHKFLESVPYALKNMNYILNERINHSELNYLRKIFGELLNDKT